MEFVVWGHDPWQRPLLQHLNWDPLWVSIFCVIMFVLAHAAYTILSAGHRRTAVEADAMEAKHISVPARILRHSLTARLFHWSMSATMFVLLLTAFFPILGLQFDWVPWHYWAGMIFTGVIVWHIVHTTVWLDFWSIWAGPKDIPAFKALMLREAGKIKAAPRAGEVSARQSALPLDPHHRRRDGDHHRHPDDVPDSNPLLPAEPVPRQ